MNSWVSLKSLVVNLNHSAVTSFHFHVMHVYLWWIHFDVWQNQYNIVKFKNKIKKKKETQKNVEVLENLQQETTQEKSFRKLSIC